MIWGMIILSGIAGVLYWSIYNRGWDEGQESLTKGIVESVDRHEAEKEETYREELSDGGKIVEEVESSSDREERDDGIMDLYGR